MGDIGNVRCIKGVDGKALAEESKIRNRWQSCFPKLFNGKMSEYSHGLERGD